MCEQIAETGALQSPIRRNIERVRLTKEVLQFESLEENRR
jgi:hypothetical protein